MNDRKQMKGLPDMQDNGDMDDLQKEYYAFIVSQFKMEGSDLLEGFKQITPEGEDAGSFALKEVEISELIRKRVLDSGINFYANESIAEFIKGGEIQLLVDEVSKKMQKVLEALVIDTSNDHNTHDTARRWAKMMVLESFRGRYFTKPKVTEFPNVKQVDELYTVGPIQVRSTCAHHLVPITGEAFIGVLPKDKLIGLSKFHRIVDHFSSRPQIQEELTMQIANEIFKYTDPHGLGVIISAKHLCCGHRGVKDPNSKMVTSVMLGSMRTQSNLKSEFLKLVEFTKT